MEPARWRRIEAVFDEAVLEPKGQARDALVRSRCEGDESLAAEVLALLNEDDRLTSAEAPPDPHIGLRLGPFEIDSLIARGGMAAVYRAHRADGQFEQQVAVKIMDMRLSDPALVARFRAERQILARLEHPALTRLLDGGVTAIGEPYFVMEYIDGEPIDLHCDRERLDIPARLRLFIQVCDGMAFAHRNLVLHRDLKPSNILVTREDHVKVVDFGTATLLEPERLATMSRAPLTPAYASPEQLMGEPVGTASDQYGLGLVLFELLTGALAFGERRSLVAAVERAMSRTTAPIPSAVATEAAAVARQTSLPRLKRLVSGELETVVAKALAYEPDRRFPSVQHMADDLQRWLDGEPVLAQASSLGYRMRKFVTRHKVEAAAAVVAVVALVGGLFVAIVQARRAEVQRQRATEVTRFLTTMLESADPGELGKDITVREVLVNATKEADALDAASPLASAVRGVIGHTFVTLGEYEAGERQLELAVAAERRVAPAGSAEAVRLLTRISHAQENAGRIDDASRSIGEAGDMLQRLSGVDAALRAEYLDQRARVLAARGNFEAAQKAFAEAREWVLAQSLGPAMRATAAANLAFTLASRGRFREAVPLYEEAIADTRVAKGPDSNAVADILSPYATVLWYLDERERALSVYQESIRVRRTTLGPDHPNYAQTVANYADSLVVMGRYEQALPLVKEILALRGRTLPDSHAVVPVAVMMMGRVLGPLGQLDEAERWIREGIALREKALPKGDWKIASSRSILGGHLVLAKRFPEAETTLVAAERELAATLGNESAVVADARQRLVDLYTAWKRPADAEQWRDRLPQASK